MNFDNRKILSQHSRIAISFSKHDLFLKWLQLFLKQEVLEARSLALHLQTTFSLLITQ